MNNFIKHIFYKLKNSYDETTKFCCNIFKEEFNEIIIQIKLMINNLYNELTIKKIISVIIFLFLFLFFQEKIEIFINNNLKSTRDFSNKYLDFSLIILSFLIIVKLYNKIILNRYKSSFIEYYVLGIILFVSIYYFSISINKSWYFPTTNIINIKIPYLILFQIPIISFFIFHFFRWSNLDIYKKEFISKENFILNDDPIIHFSNDELESSEIVSKLSSILIKDNHNKSISIGLIGPWGNGKSSIINLLENEIKKSFGYKEKDILSIHFLPYLNHKEDEIINEFFLNLSNTLSEYDGKISNQILDYSSKLTDLYKDKNLKDFFDKSINNYTNSSAQELYNTIDKMLVSLNKKIIVFIDDLDRLNQNEILQVLKLIRNTANFRNTIFVVAMDKEYVLSRLKSSEDILNSKFIDKFFQLEVYLPEIKIKTLRDYFVNELNKPFDKMPPDFKTIVNETINNPDLLFSDYIKNFRDAKRVINQIRFDLSLFQEDYYYLNFKDFINFTFFKMKFPKIMKDLSSGKSDFLKIDSKTGNYSLEVLNPEDEPNKDFYTIYINNLEKYKIYQELLKKECNDNLSINCEDKMLLIKTLAYLFGTENEIKNSDSIRKQNNFKTLMEQRFPKNYLKNNEFNHLFRIKKDDIKDYLIDLNKNQKIDQLVDRLKYFTITDTENIRSIIKALLLMYENQSAYGQYYIDILFLLSKYVENLYINEKLKNKDIDWIKKNIFEDDTIMIKTRLELLGHLWDSKHVNNLWTIDENYIFEITEKLYNDYINQFSNNLFNVNDYSIYKVYHSVKNIISNKVNKIFINFWKKNKIEILCAQTIDIDIFNDFDFKISNSVEEFFGSKQEFIKFVKEHPDKDKPEIVEFIKLFQLHEITAFQKYILYVFEHSKLMIEKIKFIKENSTRNRNSKEIKKREMFFESDYEGFINNIITNKNDFQDVLMSNYKFNDKFYLVITLNKKDESQALNDFISKLKSNLKNQNFNELEIVMPNDKNSGEIFIKIMDKYYFKTISIQPKIEPNYQIF